MEGQLEEGNRHKIALLIDGDNAQPSLIEKIIHNKSVCIAPSISAKFIYYNNKFNDKTTGVVRE